MPSEPDQPGLFLLRRIRDEAHRFAVNYHRQIRGKRIRRSSLNEIPGLGPKRIRDLLKHFQSVEAIQMADKEQLKKVPGLGKSTVEVIWEYFQSD